jgi:hypothetical protein
MTSHGYKQKKYLKNWAWEQKSSKHCQVIIQFYEHFRLSFGLRE